MKGIELKITKTLAAPIEKVWDAWTNPESIKQWLSPEGMTNPEVIANVKKSGVYRITMEGKNMPNPEHNGVMHVGGTYLVIQKPNKLVFTWLWEGAPAETHTTTITILLKEIDTKKTELTLIHSGFADDNMKKEHNMGWVSTFRKLDQFINH